MDDRPAFDVVSVTTTVGSLDDAQRLAREIVRQRLGACVQLEQVLRSVYRWEGKLCEEPEIRLVIKTTLAREEALRGLFARQHPYELPQFLVTRQRASPAYGRWCHEQVSE